jgi:hypothetical protein
MSTDIRPTERRGQTRRQAAGSVSRGVVGQLEGGHVHAWGIAWCPTTWSTTLRFLGICSPNLRRCH